MRISDWSSDVCSSDLVGRAGVAQSLGHHVGCHPPRVAGVEVHRGATGGREGAGRIGDQGEALGRVGGREAAHLGQGVGRSEEHTSELQSLMRISYAVFCLKKKNQNVTKTHKNEYSAR